MKLTFHGAAQTVTGSQHLIEVNDTRILLDCGLYQGRRQESFDINRNLPFDPTSIDAMVLSHAHIDHSGNIPNLVKHGFKGDIITSPATRDLCAAMLRDSGYIQERDAEYVNKKRKRKGEPPVEAIYTQQDAIHALKSFIGIGFERSYSLTKDVSVTLYHAGHMLGAAMVALDIADHDAGRDWRLVFSGDIGRPNIPILRDPTMLTKADIVIMESTYGGRHHPPVGESTRALRDMIIRTYKRGGKVIIPAFSVGRTQQLIYTLNQLYHENDIPKIHVFVDSPLAVNATDIFRLHPDAYDNEAMNYMTEHDPDGDLFGFPGLQYVRQVSDSKAINFFREPAVIISASGMMEHGRILHHLKNNIEDKRNTVLVVGWQAPNTLGRKLVEKAETIRIFGEEYTPRAEVVVLNGFSGHADHDGLVEWAGAYTDKPEHVYLVHGEEEAATKLAASLKDKLGYDANIPARGDSFDLE